MARDSEETWWEDDSCLNCGEFHFTPSLVPGLCVACATLGRTSSEGEYEDASGRIS